MYTPQVPRLRVLPELAARKPSDVNVMVLYFSWHGMKPETIQKLVYMKLSWSVKEDCVQAWHDFVVDGTKRDFAEQTPPWDWSEIKLGRYIGQGWTDLREFLYVTELTEEDCQKTAGIEPLDEKHPARQPPEKNPVLAAALTKIQENIKVKQEIEAEASVPGPADPLKKDVFMGFP